MSVWIIVLLILCSMVLWYFLQQAKEKEKEEEGFALQEPTTWDTLRNFFHYQFPTPDANVAIPVTMSPGLANLLPSIDASIQTPGFPQEMQSLTRLLYDDADPNRAENAKCRAIAHPKWLKSNREGRPAQQVRDGKGCGWWFVSDPAIPSMGAFGTQPHSIPGKAPVMGTALYPAELPAQGRWIWDAEEAERLETIKRCRSIATCSLLSGSTERCGFCPSKGYAVPLDESGGVRYTQDDNGNCADASRIVRVAEQCHLLTIPPQAYRGDFDYDINGNAIRNEKYFALTNPQGLSVRDPCELENGYLTKECRLNMCKELARAQVGKGIHRIVSEEGNLSETDQIALFYLKKYAAIDIPAMFWLPATVPEARPLLKSDAEDLMQRLYMAATSGPPSRSRAAALWFLNETPFNVCDFEDADQETFPIQCVQREFRKAGCQASGTGYPAHSASFKELTYGQIKGQFRDLYLKMKDTSVKNVREQDEAIQQCLGINLERAIDETYELNPNVCREQGIEYWFATIPTIGQRLLYARRVFTNTNNLVEESSPLGAECKEILNAKEGVRGFTARTYADLSGVGVVVRFEAPQDRATFYSLWVNGQPIPAQVGTQRTHYQASLATYQRSEIEVRYEGTEADLGFGSPRLTFTPNIPLYLAQSAWKPAVAVRASAEGWRDDNRYLLFEPIATKLIAGRWGAALPGVPLQSLPERGLWFSSIRTIAGMYYWTAVDGEAPLWRFDQGNGGLSETVVKLGVQEQKLVFTITSGTFTFQIRSSASVGVANRWMHVAIVLGEQFTDSRIYLEGRDVTGGQATANGTLDPKRVAFRRVVLGGAGFQGSIGWFHVYDTPLGSAGIGRDREYDNPLYSDKESSVRARSPQNAPNQRL